MDDPRAISILGRFQPENLPRLGSSSLGKRKNVSTACSACKSRRSKCSGQQPCESCVRHHVECVFREDDDKRRRLPLTRRIQTLEQDRSLLFDLIGTIRESDETQLLQLLYRFRKDVSVGEVKDQVNDHIHRQLERNLESVDLTGLSLQRMRTKCAPVPRSLELLHKEPLCDVHSVHQWTSVVDDATAAHLFTLYFNWESQIWHFIDSRLFLQDLNARRHRFCSRLLVHTVLFYACRFSYDLEQPWNRRVENEIGSRLFAQIVQLWDRGKAEPCLTTAQSSILLGIAMCASGQDKLGVRFVEFGYHLASRIGVHTDNPTCFAPDPFYDSADLRRAHKTIAWGIYDYQATLTQGTRQRSFWPDPPLVPFSEEDAAEADRDQLWTPYPFKSPSYPSTRHATLYARGSLVPIMIGITDLAVTHANKLPTIETWSAGEAFHKRLLAWKASLPDYLEIERDHSPPTLCLHMSYHITVMSLCEIFGTSTHPAADTDSPNLFHPQALTSLALESVGSLILLYRAFHGWKSMPVVMMHYFVIVGVHSIHRLQDSADDEDKWVRVLTASVSGLWHMNLSWPFCRFFLRTIQLIFESSEMATAPPEVSTIFNEMNSKVWTAATAKSLSSAYIIHQLPGATPGGPSASPSRVADTECVEDVINALDKVSIS